jgi:hypothetical protein
MENDTPQIKTDKPIQLDILDLENTSKIDRLAYQTADTLAKHPELTSDLSHQVNNILHLSSPNASTDSVAHQSVAKFLERCRDYVAIYKWRDLQHQPLTSSQAAVILENISDPETSTHSDIPKEQQLIHQITNNIAFGYLNQRFEHVKVNEAITNDWKGSLATLRVFLEATLDNVENIPLREKFLNLTSGKYENIMSDKSLVWRSIFLGMRDVHPDDEQFMIIANEIDTSTSYIAKSLGKYQLFQEKSAAYIPLQDIFDSLLNHYPTRGATPDLQEVALSHQKYPDRSQKFSDFIENSLVGTVRGSGFLSFDLTKDKDNHPDFPANTVMSVNNSSLMQKARCLVPDETFRSHLRSKAEAKAAKTNSVVIPVAIPGSIHGFALIPKSEIPVGSSDRDRLRKAIAILTKPENLTRINEQIDLQNQSFQAALTDVIFDGGEIFVTENSLAPKTPLETAFELLTPEQIRKHSLDVLSEMTHLRFQIARDFAKSINPRGIEYLFENTEIGDIFKQADLSLNKSGGFNVVLSLNGISELHVPEMTISAKVVIGKGSVKVELYDQATLLPPDLEWFTKREILRLISSECCKTHDQIPVENGESLELSPEGKRHIKSDEDEAAHLVHIGVKKKSGAPGEHTLAAEAKRISDMYGRVIEGHITPELIADLYQETGGVSLVEINRQHKTDHPECPMNLTWRTATDTKSGRPPITRQASPEIFRISSATT